MTEGRKVREDFVGVIYLGGLALGAGADIPDGFEIGAHVTGEQETAEPAVVPEEAPAEEQEPTDGKPRGNASLEVWQDYAKSQGATDEDLDGMSRDEVRDLYAD